MSFWRQLKHGTRALLRRAAVEREIDDEAGHFLDEMARDFESKGFSPEQARRAARIEMGSPLAVRERVRGSAWDMAVAGVAEDCRYAIRRLCGHPGFSAAAILTLGLGIGATVTVFAAVDAVLLRPLPYPHSERLVALRHTAPGVNVKEIRMSAAFYFTYREEARVFENMALWDGHRTTVSGIGPPEEEPTLFVTHEFLDVLGIRPALGRGLTAADDDVGSPATVLLSNSYWRQQFGSNAGAIGKEILVDGIPHEVIGVLPQSFEFLDENVALMVPRRLRREEARLIQFDADGIARLKPGVTLEQANADVARCVPLAAAKFPLNAGLPRNAFLAARITPDLRFLKDQFVGDVGKTLWILLAAVTILLLIAAANVANLQLVRADGRKEELALRVALGASPARIARDLLAESVVLGFAGGAAGLAVSSVALRLIITSTVVRLPRLASISIGYRTLAFTLAISLVTSIFFGLIPVCRYTLRRPADTLPRGRERTFSLSRDRRRTQHALVVLQVALAIMLLIGAGLMIRTFLAIRRVDPGFTGAEQVQAVRVSIPLSLIRDPEPVMRLEEAILRQFESVPGVRSVGLTTSLPMDGGTSSPIFIADHLINDGKLPAVRRVKEISPGFFQSIGSRFIAGRDFTWQELYRAAPVALISENMARELWGSPRAALGKRIRESASQDWHQIVGVVADLRDEGITQNAPAMVFWPVMRKNMQGIVGATRHIDLVIRSPRAGTAQFVRELKQALQAVNANVPLANIRTLRTIYKRSLARSSFALMLLGVFGAMALLLGIVGIYGVVAYSVAQRKRDIGIRIALGAPRQGVTAMFIREACVLAGIGAMIGLVLGCFVTRGMSALVFGVPLLDPITYGAVVSMLLPATFLASWLPARKAARMEPLEALRGE